MNRAARQIERLSEQFAFQHSLRAIESVHAQVHDILLQWGRWGKDRFPGRPEIARPAVWDLPGAYDPDLDTEAMPESLEVPICERDVLVADEAINQPEFPAIWVKLLKVNYIWRPIEWDRPLIARVGQQAYLDQLHRALEELG